MMMKESGREEREEAGKGTEKNTTTTILATDIYQALTRCPQEAPEFIRKTVEF